MGLTLKTTRPDPPVPGETLTRSSVAGRKTQFINQSTTGAGSVTLLAGQSWVSSANLALWPPDMPTVARTKDNLIAISNCVAWPYFNCFVDNDLDLTHYIGYGSGLSADQAAVEFEFMPQLTSVVYPGATFIGYSHSWLFRIVNRGASTHTVYLYFTSKFIILGDTNL